jgi:DNA polymerase-1
MIDRNAIVVVDAYAQIYRGFYAIRGLTDSQGNPTNALFAVARFMLWLDTDYRSDFGAVAFDKGPPEKRLEILPEYKATRPPMPDELRAQIEPIREWIHASGWPLLEQQGFEADDIIAAIAAMRENHRVYIVSHDKDLAQLVNENVVQLIPGKKGAVDELNPAAVEAKFGIPPGAIQDYLALLGDSSDNIPGVSGVGAKTAATLLQQFGSIDEMLNRTEEIKRPAIREKIESSREILDRNRQLVALDEQPPEGLDSVEKLRRTPPEWDKLLELAKKYEFKSLVNDIEKARTADRSPTLF